MLESLITSKTRLKLLLKFFLNPGTKAYLREIAAEFGESTNAVRIELNRLAEAKLLSKSSEGRTVQYRANTNHSFFMDIEMVVRKYVGLDKLVVTMVDNLGHLEMAMIVGDYAHGIDSGLIDLVLVGDVSEEKVLRLAKKTEALISRKIRTIIFKPEDLPSLYDRLEIEQALVLWEAASET